MKNTQRYTVSALVGLLTVAFCFTAQARNDDKYQKKTVTSQTTVQGSVNADDDANADVTVQTSTDTDVKRPHGWDKGKKKGWNDRDVPPGRYESTSETTTTTSTN